MSDFEINKKVVDKHLHMFVNEEKSRGRLDSDVWVFDSEGLPRNTNYNPCNNPSDAWPIIVENKIDIAHTVSGYVNCAVFKPDDRGMYREFYTTTETTNKTLRAAMICFLKMKDAEK